MLLALAALWGASFLFIKVAVRELAPATLIVGRLGLAAVTLGALVPFVVGTGETLRQLRANAGWLVTVALVNTAIPFWLLSWGETRIDSGLASIIQAAVPIFNAVLAFAAFREVADSVGAILLVDMAHFAGLVAAGEHPNPVPHAQIVTTTTHKTLRGPRGGMILCTQEYAKAVDKAVFPYAQGGPLMHVIAGKAVALKEAALPEFKTYAKQIRANARTLAAALATAGLRVVSGGTDNHLMLVDVRPVNLTGKGAERLLDAVGITVNKNTIPYDPQKPGTASGIRIGTPAITTRGMKEAEMERIGALIARALREAKDETIAKQIADEVLDLTRRFPVPGISPITREPARA
jgi:glycine/serine hydroxymethyltransferase